MTQRSQYNQSRHSQSNSNGGNVLTRKLTKDIRKYWYTQKIFLKKLYLKFVKLSSNVGQKHFQMVKIEYFR